MQIIPVEMIDTVWRLIGIVDALLVAQHLFATKHEGYALRQEHCCLCQQVEAYQLCRLFPIQLPISRVQRRHTGFQPVYETHVIMTTHV